jgi:hypothetical protein
MADISDGCEVGILKWSARRKSISRTITRLHKIQERTQGVKVKESAHLERGTLASISISRRTGSYSVHMSMHCM